MNLPRKLFQTPPMEWGVSPDGTRAVIKLIATFVILVAQSAMKSELDQKPGPLTRCKEGIPCRVLDLQNYVLSAADVIFPGGIFLDERPLPNEKLFYIVQPLGQGRNGVCCLAAKPEGHVCVVKFLRVLKDPMLLNTSKRLPNKKRRTGKTYTRLGMANPTANLLKAIPSGTECFFPLFRVPVDLDDRKEFISGQDTSLLKKGLEFFASKKKIHNDLKWRHIGVPPKGSYMLVLLDLGEGGRLRRRIQAF
jgi:hypothetical protein